MSEAAPWFGGSPRCVAPLRVDGGTTWAARVSEATMRPELVEWLELVRETVDPIIEDIRRQEGWVTLMPLEGFGEHYPSGQTIVSGTDRDRIVWHCTDRCYITFWRRICRKTGEETWYVRAQAKARELYAVSLERWFGAWLGPLGDALGIRNVGEPQWQGWSTTQLHLNSDFVGLEFDPIEDFSNFTGARSKTAMGTPSAQHSRVRKNGELQTLSTIELGTRVSDMQLVIYRKSQHCRQKLKVRPDASMYAPLWCAHEWRGEEVTRVEFRLRKKGLFWRSKLTASEDIDLHDPSKLIEQETLVRLWSRMTSCRRLIVRDDERKARCSTDPRWSLVQSLAWGVDGSAMRQVDRRARKLSDDEKRAKHVRAVLRAMAGLMTHDGLLNDECGAEGLRADSVHFERIMEGMRAFSRADPKLLEVFVDDHYPVPLRQTLAGVVSRTIEQREWNDAPEPERTRRRGRSPPRNTS